MTACPESVIEAMVVPPVTFAVATVFPTSAEVKPLPESVRVVDVFATEIVAMVRDVFGRTCVFVT
jgi:hypothetical protein